MARIRAVVIIISTIQHKATRQRTMLLTVAQVGTAVVSGVLIVAASIRAIVIIFPTI